MLNEVISDMVPNQWDLEIAQLNFGCCPGSILNTHQE